MWWRSGDWRRNALGDGANFVARFNQVFSNACAGHLEIYGLPQISIRRFVIDGGSLAAGSECNALAVIGDVPDIRSPASSYDMEAGDLVYGLIDSSGEADAYGIRLYPGTYTFDLLGSASGSGTLQDPSLSLYDSNLDQLAENDDRDPSSSESRITYTVTTTGVYQLRVRSSSKNAGSGSFLLKASGIFPGAQPAVFLPALDMVVSSPANCSAPTSLT